MTTREILEEARELITPPEHWAGPPSHPHYPPSCFCAATAIWTAAEGYAGAVSSKASEPAGDALARTVGVEQPSARGRWRDIYDWNDSSDHDTVLAAFDQTIADLVD